MLGENLVELRKYHNMSQEELADRIGVSRQTLSKYETGESLPDIEKSQALAEVFGVSLDDLVKYKKEENMGLGVPPKGKYIFGMVKVGEKGQIVIPAKARKLFDIKPGDNLIVLGDEGQGIAIIKEKGLMELLGAARKRQ
ncbi:helix-turn-helix domain-containing protein [Kineothrix sp. MSJ-39]|uniref:helix-turn-helix domain-containing protein n=1 Tax=Kineothrix sp. MSJ-39 TaxID=2841533 RepID=UPI001C1040C0|nr:helix-turn-helix domain-containing protein [Kineothrix sp. MSJ-39]MBU5430663.1 helix-turn-helix domain-containing protein [Kineothrix sp. MSJ-39]